MMVYSVIYSAELDSLVHGNDYGSTTQDVPGVSILQRPQKATEDMKGKSNLRTGGQINLLCCQPRPWTGTTASVLFRQNMANVAMPLAKSTANKIT